VRVTHRVVFGRLEAVQHVLAPHSWQITTAFVEWFNRRRRQHGAAIGRRPSALCQGEDGWRQQLSVSHAADHFGWLHASLR